MKNQMKGNNGITLIALVITIIVLLILAGVTIATLTGDNGLLQKATNAKEANEEATALEKIKVEVVGSYGLDGKIDKEQLNKNLKKINGLTYKDSEIDLNDDTKKITTFPATVNLSGKAFTIFENGDVDKVAWISNNDGSYTNVETGQNLSVGDTVKYETILNKEENAVDSEKLPQLRTDLKNYSGDSSSTDNANINRDNLTWKFLDIKDGQIRLISALPSSKKISLWGYRGYNNAVYLIDEACSTLYGSNKGTSKNIKIEDIEEKINKTQFDYTQYVSENSNIIYGGTKEFNFTVNCSNIYTSEIGCKAINGNTNIGTLDLSEQDNLVSGTYSRVNQILTTQTCWSKEMALQDYISSNYYNIFHINGSSYWISSRCVNISTVNSWYSVFRVSSESIKGQIMQRLNDDTSGSLFGIRPVVTLNSDVQLESDGTNTWKIK